MDETWVHIYDPETEEQSKEWRERDSSRPKISRTQTSSKALASVFCDKDGKVFSLSSGTKMEFYL
jgi:hypothetical protein